jgi:uncharacterized protein YgiM (DUF1202 family)
MANDISSGSLIALFQLALDDHWGYIWGTAGVEWTKAKQAALEKTTDANRANSRRYGSKWIGHMVADCSGLFYWAFNQLGGYMYHGSNTMWDKYCASKGELIKGQRDDGQVLKPGTAVFCYNKSTGKRGHVGLFVGSGLVIEAAGAKAGVITSKITDKKWVEWGELIGVIYGDPEPVPPVPEGYAIVTGKNLALRQGPSTSCKVITRAPTGSKVKITEPPSDWEYVTYNGKQGYMMKMYLKE